jgi:hypothetical protein
MATSDFGRAFAAARKAGKKDFEHGGKKFSTETREEKSSRVGKAVSDKSDAMRGASRAATAPAAKAGADKRRKAAADAKFAASVGDYVRSRSAERDRKEKLGLAMDVAGAALPAAKLAQGARGALAAAKAARATPSIGPTGVARKVMPSRPVTQVGRKTGVSSDARRSAEGFSPDEALKAIAKKAPAKSAPAKSAPAKSAPAKSAPAKSTRAKKPSNPPPADDFGAGMRRGGKVAKKRYI